MTGAGLGVGVPDVAVGSGADERSGFAIPPAEQPVIANSTPHVAATPVRLTERTPLDAADWLTVDASRDAPVALAARKSRTTAVTE
jgi:hypothetical protein